MNQSILAKLRVKKQPITRKLNTINIALETDDDVDQEHIAMLRNRFTEHILITKLASQNPQQVNTTVQNKSIVNSPNTNQQGIEPGQQPNKSSRKNIGDNSIPEKLDEPMGREPILLDEIEDIDVTNYEPIQLKHSKYYLHNREIFINFIDSLYKKSKKDKETEPTCDDQNENSDFALMTHQKIVREYISTFAPYRGLLLFHGLGSGKTCSSIAIAEGLKTEKQILVLTPAALRTNYIEELKKCGDILYKKNKFWKFVETNDNVDIIHTLSKVLSLDAKIIQKQGGAWLVNLKEPNSNYYSLTIREKKQLDTQINAMIENKYEFWNYNGMRRAKYDNITKNNTINPFHNKVVIIDEAHNFVGRIVNKLGSQDALSIRMYNHLMEAQDVKIVMLSGTPIINYPNEIAVLFNILRGYIKTWSIKLNVTDTTKVSLPFLKSIFTPAKKGSNVLDYIDYNVATTTLVITRNPFGFVNIGKKGKHDGVHRGERGLVQDQDFIGNISKILKDNKINIQVLSNKDKTKNITLNAFKVLPDDLKTFKSYFINDDNTIKNMDLFRKRVLGLSSYFHDMYSLMPQYDKTNFHVIKIPMSNYQFGHYEMARVEERKLELNNSKRAKKNADADIYDNSVSTYRIFSRAFCNFVFPVTIPRPLPGGATDIEGAVHNESINENDIDAIPMDQRKANVNGEFDADDISVEDVSYTSRIQEAMNTMDANKETLLTNASLENLSPKFSKILENLIDIELVGKHLIYSQFRTMEGIGILKLVLEANGFAEFKLKRIKNEWQIVQNVEDEGKPMFALYTGTESREEKEIIRNIFNGSWSQVTTTIAAQLASIANHQNNLMGDVIKTLMISASGAEGISLKNVRYVHITEPYWHPVRIQQVIGRARRICSHQDLPEELRTVSVFLYLMEFTIEQSQSDDAIELRLKDKGKLVEGPLSSDEALFEISNIKESINSNILSAVKEASIDCGIHNKGTKNIKCFNFGGADSEKFVSKPSIEKEEKDNVANINKTTEVIKPVEMIHNGVAYAFDPNTNKIYDYDDFLNGLVRQVGSKNGDDIEFLT